MALSTLAAITIQRAALQCRTLLEDVRPVLAELNAVYNAGGGVGLSSTIQQADLDAAANLSGLTKAQLDDALFGLTSGVLGALTNAHDALALLAGRTPGV